MLTILIISSPILLVVIFEVSSFPICIFDSLGVQTGVIAVFLVVCLLSLPLVILLDDGSNHSLLVGYLVFTGGPLGPWHLVNPCAGYLFVVEFKPHSVIKHRVHLISLRRLLGSFLNSSTVNKLLIKHVLLRFLTNFDHFSIDSLDLFD